MEKSFGIIAAAVVLGLGAFGCSESIGPVDAPVPEEGVPVSFVLENPLGEPMVVALLAGQYIEVGTVTVSNDETLLSIAIDTSEGDWVLTETHVAVADNLEDLPQTGSGNPQVGHFDLSAEHDPPVTSWTYEIEYTYVPGAELFIAVHAVVWLLDGGGAPIQEETAWADGIPFPGNNWATYLNYTVQSGPENGGGE